LTEKNASQAERWAIVACSMAVSMLAIVWSWEHDAMLNYGDAVAHLHIARRIFDSRTPRFSQLGSVWLPLPHILLIPFVQNYEWWANGLAGVIPSALAYIAACAGIYLLARHFVSRAASALALAFFALNPNLLYLQTTAMTEPLFLCEMIWIVVWMVEWRAAMSEEIAQARKPPFGNANVRRTRGPIAASIEKSLREIGSATARRRGAWLPGAFQHPERKRFFPGRSSRLMACVAGALVAAILTRYDGWILALIAWMGVGLMLWSYRRLDSGAFWLMSLAVAAAPVFWFIYNSAAFGDWLYFARGPFSAKAIEVRTAPAGAGPLHPGWHSPWVALLFFVKVAELDAIAAAAKGNFIANLVLIIAALGTAARGIVEKSRGSGFAWVLLLWVPVPFYAWSVAYGSVPIFFPSWWPYTLYNTRYGLELLPALALGLGFAAESLVRAVTKLRFSRALANTLDRMPLAPTLVGVIFAISFALVSVNAAQLAKAGPVVYAESTKNLEARLPYDESIPPVLQDLLSLVPHAPVLMNTSAYPEIVAFTGIPLRQTINESDLEIFRAALAAPARSAAIVVTFDGDEVDGAVKAHPEDLTVAGRFTAQAQPAATVYISTKWLDRSPLWKSPMEKLPGEKTEPGGLTPGPH
jgi:hypothetical protein